MSIPVKASRCNYDFCVIAAKFCHDIRKSGSYCDPLKRSPTLITESTMSGKLLGLVAAAALLVSIGAANAKDPVKLADGQLDKVTAGAGALQIPVNAALFANGSNGPGGVNQFSPATATVTQTNIPTVLNLFTVH
jgi:hypothetical protein